MKRVLKKIILVLICLLPLTAVAQEKKPENKGAISPKAQRKAARQKWKDQRKQERLQKKNVEAHLKRLQSKNTLKSMKREKKKSERLRENRRETIWERWFN